MNTALYFYGDTPQRGIYNKEYGTIDIINSGALFIRDYLTPRYDYKCERDERLPLKLYKSIGRTTKEAIKDDDLREYVQSYGVNFVYRLQGSELLEYPATKKPAESFETEEDGRRIIVVWTEKDRFDGIPLKADYYVWIATDKLPDPDFLKKHDGQKIIIVQGDALRKNGAKISKGLSWEETALDTVWQYNQNKEIRNRLRFARLLIVTYGFEGAIVLNPGNTESSKSKNQLFFHNTKTEGDIQNEYIGLIPEAFELFVLKIIDRICVDDIDKIIDHITKNMAEFLSAQMSTHICGYDKYSVIHRYKTETMVEPELLNCVSSDFFSSVIVPDHDTSWSIPPNINMFRGNISFLNNFQKLEEIVNNGAVNAKLNCPILRIGEFESVGRSEIESYSAIKNLLRNYINSPFQGKPLSIAVFGQPGSGKSFGVKEIAKNIMGKETSFLEFNLSQYGEAQISALYEVFHDIQDQTLKGKVPFVFFDEFDSHELDWLKCFLMPMQDGEFIEHGRKRPIGKCIFIFAGGLYHSYEKFIEAINTMGDVLIDKKLPDFLSRIKGYVNILGVNPETVDNMANAEFPKDHLYIIKRAMMLSSMLKRIGKSTNKKISLSEDVLRALLYTKKFRHGARSMEAILEMSNIPSNNILEISDMPSSSQLELHVDSVDFNNFLRQRIHWNELVGRIARKYAMLYQSSWECISSETQNMYYKNAEILIDYIFNGLKLSISLCGDTGRIEDEQISKRKLVLFSDYRQYRKIDKDKLNSLILQSQYYLGCNGTKTAIQLPDNPEEYEQYMTDVREEVLFILKPFDIDPEDTGFYLHERE